MRVKIVVSIREFINSSISSIHNRIRNQIQKLTKLQQYVYQIAIAIFRNINAVFSRNGQQPTRIQKKVEVLQSKPESSITNISHVGIEKKEKIKITENNPQEKEKQALILEGRLWKKEHLRIPVKPDMNKVTESEWKRYERECKTYENNVKALETFPDEFMTLIKKMQELGHKIKIEKTEDKILIYHTPAELLCWFTLSRVQLNTWMSEYIAMDYGESLCPAEKGITTITARDKYKEEEIVGNLKKELESTAIKQLPQVIMPEFSSFSGSSEEVSSLFTSLLKDQEGLVIGEECHTDDAPRQVLVDQMQNLSQQDVKTLFLEFCCFDTLQEELDDFYKTKKPSSFLREFLEGSSQDKYNGRQNYFPVVEAAIKAGIRVVGLERWDTYQMGFQKMGGAQGEERMLGLNIPGKKIIEEQVKEGKYIVLVGAGHNSYCDGIPGFSELLGIPSLVIGETQTQPEYFPNHQKLSGDERYRVNALIRIAPKTIDINKK